MSLVILSPGICSIPSRSDLSHRSFSFCPVFFYLSTSSLSLHAWPLVVWADLPHWPRVCPWAITLLLLLLPLGVLRGAWVPRRTAVRGRPPPAPAYTARDQPNRNRFHRAILRTAKARHGARGTVPSWDGLVLIIVVTRNLYWGISWGLFHPFFSLLFSLFPPLLLHFSPSRNPARKLQFFGQTMQIFDRKNYGC